MLGGTKFFQGNGFFEVPKSEAPLLSIKSLSRPQISGTSSSDEVGYNLVPVAPHFPV